MDGKRGRAMLRKVGGFWLGKGGVWWEKMEVYGGKRGIARVGRGGEFRVGKGEGFGWENGEGYGW